MEISWKFLKFLEILGQIGLAEPTVSAMRSVEGMRRAHPAARPPARHPAARPPARPPARCDCPLEPCGHGAGLPMVERVCRLAGPRRRLAGECIQRECCAHRGLIASATFAQAFGSGALPELGRKWGMRARRNAIFLQAFGRTA